MHHGTVTQPVGETVKTQVHMVIPNPGFFPVYQEGTQTSNLDRREDRPCPNPAAFYLHEGVPGPKVSKENHIPGFSLLFQSVQGAGSFLKHPRGRDTRYYLQPEYINHLNAEIQFGEWLGVHSSILTKYSPGRCVPWSRNLERSQPNHAAHYWEQLKVEGFRETSGPGRGPALHGNTPQQHQAQAKRPHASDPLPWVTLAAPLRE